MAFQYVRRGYKRDNDSLQQSFLWQDKGKWFKRKGRDIQIGYKKEVFDSMGDESPEQVAQRGGGCLVPGDIQG